MEKYIYPEPVQKIIKSVRINWDFYLDEDEKFLDKMEIKLLIKIIMNDLFYKYNRDYEEMSVNDMKKVVGTYQANDIKNKLLKANKIYKNKTGYGDVQYHYKYKEKYNEMDKVQKIYLKTYPKKATYIFINKKWGCENLNNYELKLILYIGYNSLIYKYGKNYKKLNYKQLSKIISKNKIKESISSLLAKKIIERHNELKYDYNFDYDEPYYRIPSRMLKYANLENIRGNSFLVYFELIRRLYNSLNKRLTFYNDNNKTKNKTYGQKILKIKEKNIYKRLENHMSRRTLKRSLTKIHKKGLLNIYNNLDKKQIELPNTEDSIQINPKWKREKLEREKIKKEKAKKKENLDLYNDDFDKLYELAD